MIIETALELTKIWCSTATKQLEKKEVLDAYEYFKGELLLKIKPATPFIFQETDEEPKKEDKNSSDFFKKVFKM